MSDVFASKIEILFVVEKFHHSFKAPWYCLSVDDVIELTMISAAALSIPLLKNASRISSLPPMKACVPAGVFPVWKETTISFYEV